YVFYNFNDFVFYKKPLLKFRILAEVLKVTLRFFLRFFFGSFFFILFFGLQCLRQYLIRRFFTIKIPIVIFFKQWCGCGIFSKHKSIRTHTIYIVKNDFANGQYWYCQKHPGNSPNGFCNDNTKKYHKRV